MFFLFHGAELISMSGCLLTVGGFHWLVLNASAVLHTELNVLLVVEIMTERPGADLETMSDLTPAAPEGNRRVSEKVPAPNVWSFTSTNAVGLIFQSVWLFGWNVPTLLKFQCRVPVFFPWMIKKRKGSQTAIVSFACEGSFQTSSVFSQTSRAPAHTWILQSEQLAEWMGN